MVPSHQCRKRECKVSCLRPRPQHTCQKPHAHTRPHTIFTTEQQHRAQCWCTCQYFSLQKTVVHTNNECNAIIFHKINVRSNACRSYSLQKTWYIQTRWILFNHCNLIQPTTLTLETLLFFGNHRLFVESEWPLEKLRTAWLSFLMVKKWRSLVRGSIFNGHKQIPLTTN